jgi:division protein CdvB (Snf7/Vps24/ESCRT-III family)
MAKDLVRTRRYVQKFYQMRTQLQAVGLRIQTLRSNQQMADAMRGATRVRLPCPARPAHPRRSRRAQAMASMNRGMNLPQIQRIMNEFERESEMMDMKGSVMEDAIDDAMDDGELEDEETEGDNILKQVLDEIGVEYSQEVRRAPGRVRTPLTRVCSSRTRRLPWRPRRRASDNPSRSARPPARPHGQPQATPARAQAQARALAAAAAAACPTRTHYRRGSTRCARADARLHASTAVYIYSARNSAATYTRSDATARASWMLSFQLMPEPS